MSNESLRYSRDWTEPATGFVQSLVDDILNISQRLDAREQSAAPLSEQAQDTLTRTMLYKGFRVGWLFYLHQYTQLGDMVTTLLDALDRQDTTPPSTAQLQDHEVLALRDSIRRLLSTR